MSCPTCDHTMSDIGHEVFHCPRCGTLLGCPIDGAVHVPALVQRCRDFADPLGLHSGPVADDLKSSWVEYGIAESIDLPGERDKL